MDSSRLSADYKIEECDPLFGDDEETSDLKAPPRLVARRSRLRPFRQKPDDLCKHRKLHAILVVAALIITNLITAQSIRWRYTGMTQSSDHCFFYTPVSDQIDLPLVTKQRDKRLAPNASDPDHIYRLRPSPEVDKAWQRISYTNIYGVSGEEVRRLGKDTNIAVPTPEEWHLGTTQPSYMMQIDVFHQLHCLNALRMALVYNYPYYWGSRFGFEPPAVFQLHIDHCLDILRQDLMCYTDTSAITYNWIDVDGEPEPDFGIQKKCRDFDHFLEWAERTRLKNETLNWEKLKKPEDAIVVPVEVGEGEGPNITGYREGVPLAPLVEMVDLCAAVSSASSVAA